MIANSGLTLAIVNTYSDLTHPGEGVRKREIEQLQRDIETAAALGAEHVRIVSGQHHPETSSDQGVQWAVAGFRQAADTARQAGIRLVYENHSKPGNWQYADFSLVPEHFLRIADELKNTGIEILVYDLAIGGNVRLPSSWVTADEVIDPGGSFLRANRLGGAASHKARVQDGLAQRDGYLLGGEGDRVFATLSIVSDAFLSLALVGDKIEGQLCVGLGCKGFLLEREIAAGC